MIHFGEFEMSNAEYARKRVGSIYICYPTDDPIFKNKITVSSSFHPTPERGYWPPSDERKPFECDPKRLGPSNNSMIAYLKSENEKFLKLGLLTPEIFEELKNWDTEASASFHAEFADLPTARVVFEAAIKAGVVDIYLYQDGKLIAKYD